MRLTGEDGYRAQRSYSLTSPPSDPLIEMFVERLPDGEVSGYLAGRCASVTASRCAAYRRMVRVERRSPALGIGGGSGVAPLLSMLRHARDRVAPTCCASSWQHER